MYQKAIGVQAFWPIRWRIPPSRAGRGGDWGWGWWRGGRGGVRSAKAVSEATAFVAGGEAARSFRLGARRQRPSRGTRARPRPTRDQRWKGRGRGTGVPAEATIDTTNAARRNELSKATKRAAEANYRRRDGGGNRRGSRCALSRRRSSDWHPLWGLSDASDRRRVGEREHGPVAETTSPETDPMGDGVYCIPRTARPEYDPPLACAPSSISRLALKLARQPTSGRWHKRPFMSRQARLKQRRIRQTRACTPSSPGRGLPWGGVHALLEGRSLPWVGFGRGRRRHRCGIAHEPFERRDDRRRLLGRGSRRNDRQLRSPVHWGDERIVRVRALASGARSRHGAGGRFRRDGDRTRAGRPASLSGGRVGDAVEGLPREPAVR